ncbi:hypothetical protein GCM10020218_062260 [Dactylosporangium vinaceum]
MSTTSMAAANPAISRTRKGSRRHRTAMSATVRTESVAGAAEGLDGVPAERLSTFPRRLAM